MKRKVNWKTTKKRLIAILSMVALLGVMCFEGIPASAEETGTSEKITVDSLKEQGFEYWTLSDVCETDRSVEADNATTIDTSGYLAEGSLDKTIFTAKIGFSEGKTNGRWHIGGATDGKGFLFRTDSDATSLRLQLKYGSSTISIDDFTAQNAGVDTLRGNSELTVSLSVEYTNVYTESDVEYADLKVGVFFNGNLYKNTYYNVTKVPTSELGKRVSFYSAGAYTITSNYLWYREIGFAEAELKKAGYEYWTLSDVCEGNRNIANDSATNIDTFGYLAEGSLDKTIFTAKIGFSEGKTNGRWHIGGATDGKGFLFRTDSDATSLRLQLKYGSSTISIDDFTAQNAGVDTLRGNSELTVSLSVEYTNVYTESDVEYADLKVGVFFGGKLYKNTYYDVTKVPTSELGKRVSFYSAGAYTIASSYLWDRDIEFSEAELKEAGYEYWTLSDVGEADRTVEANGENNTDTQGNCIGTSLDKTVFSAKMKFPYNAGSVGRWYIGGLYESKGFVFRATNEKATTPESTIQLNLHSGDYGAIVAVFDPKVAGTALKGNPDLTVSLAVEYLTPTNGTDGYANLKVGVFFNGKLYNDAYIDLENVPTDALVQKVQFYSINEYSMASNYLWTRKLVDTEMKEKGYEFWSLSDLGIEDQAELAETHILGRIDDSSLHKTVFVSKIQFATGSGDFGRFFIGDKDGGSGLLFRAYGTDSLRFDLHYTATENLAKSGTVIDYIDPTTAGVPLRGNDSLVVAVSVEYIGDTYLVDGVECAKLKVGVFFNGRLYNNQYYTTDYDGKELVAPVLHLRKAVSFDASTANYPGFPFTALSTTSMMNKVTFRDVDIVDGAYANTTAVSATYGTDCEDMNGMLFAGEVLYTEGQTGHIYIAGATEKNGLVLTNNDDGTLTLANTAGAGSCPEAISFTSEKAGTTLVGEAFNLKFTLQYVNANRTGGSNDLKLGVWFNGVLYNNGYIYYYDCLDTMGTYLGVYTDDDASSVRIASDRSELPEEVDVHGLEKGAYLLSGETGADVTDLLNGTVVSYETGATLNAPGQYKIVLYKGIYTRTATLYRLMDAHVDNKVNVKDLVAVLKMKNGVAPVGGLNEIVNLSADTDGDKDVDATDVKNVRDNLVGSF